MLLFEQDEKEHIMDDAEKEVGNVLNENLAHKFRGTKQYKDIKRMIFSPAGSFHGQSCGGTLATRLEVDLSES